MVHEGVIVAVMETWPLQLTLDSDHGQYQVMLSENPVVRRADGSPGDIGFCGRAPECGSMVTW